MMAAAQKRPGSARLHRWTAAGRTLQQRDPARFGALLEIAEQIVRTHDKLEAAAQRRLRRIRRLAKGGRR